MEEGPRHHIHFQRSNTTLRLVLILSMVLMGSQVGVVQGAWCVIRSDASEQLLQSGLDYACAAGADCTPIQESGLCFLPNTLQAHASYAYNSFFQRNNMAPGSCDFSGTATLAKTDPSYGSCVYPASPSTAGSITSTTTGTIPTTGTTTTTNPNRNAPPSGTISPLTPTTVSPFGGSGLNPSMGPPVSTTSDSTPSEWVSIATTLLLQVVFLLFALAAV